MTSLSWYERQAADLEPHVAGYFWGGAGAEVTMRRNVEAWQQHRFVPRVLRQTSLPSLETTLFGTKLPHPVIAAPMAFQTGLHADGERGLSKAMGDAVYCLSTSAGTPPEGIHAPHRWYQLYLRDGVDEAIQRITTVARLGYAAVVVTVDLPVLGVRDRERDHPWPGTDVVPTLSAVLAASPLDWAGFKRLVRASPVPVLIKGILHPDDAVEAVNVGAAGVVVSNHGGRQLDLAVTTAEALPGVVAAVRGQVPVLVDSGLRRGADAAVALALGADAVLLGRPLLHGLAVDGEAGARRVLELFVEELTATLMLVGVGNVQEVRGLL